jgi:hypothetical protein
METSKTANRYSAEVRSRAVRAELPVYSVERAWHRAVAVRGLHRPAAHRACQPHALDQPRHLTARRCDGLALKLPPDLANPVDLEVRLLNPPDIALQGYIAACPGGQFGRIGALCRMCMVGARGEGGKGSTCIAGGKPAEGIGRTRQIGSTP